MSPAHNTFALYLRIFCKLVLKILNNILNEKNIEKNLAILGKCFEVI